MIRLQKMEGDMLVRFHVGSTEEMEQFDYDDMELIGLDESEIADLVEYDLDVWAENQIDKTYEIIEEE